jgi:hypothetical protein
MSTSDHDFDKAVEEAAERIFASGILDEIVQAAEDGVLDQRDASDDAYAIARIALGR